MKTGSNQVLQVLPITLISPTVLNLVLAYSVTCPPKPSISFWPTNNVLPQCQWSGIAFNNKTLPQKFTTPQIHRQNLTAIQPRSFNLVSLPNPPIIEVQVGWANWPGQSLNNFNETFTRSSLALNMNRKLPLNQKFAIHGKIMAKKRSFFMKFSTIFDIFQILQP